MSPGAFPAFNVAHRGIENLAMGLGTTQTHLQIGGKTLTPEFTNLQLHLML